MTDINLLGRTLGPFEIISELGRGGMAVVYKARQADLERTVALKILPPELSLDKSYLARFLQEARSAAALEHPHIMPIYAVGAAEGINYIAMKFIAGQTLKDIVQERGALDIAEAAILLDQVADALDYAHSRGVIHRDIKPSNMMTDQNGWVYLTDFGLARGGNTGGLTMAGTVMGTPLGKSFTAVWSSSCWSLNLLDPRCSSARQASGMERRRKPTLTTRMLC